jgi:diguanylate cyclase (GGDEF)-like protein/PAS domain S-box-containing protein
MTNKPDEQDVLKAEAEAQFACTLRAAAERKLAQMPPADTPTRPVEEILHELQVRQIELEMQNDELRRAQVSIEESRDRYVDFYDFAPVGYIILSRETLIDEINLAGATLLGDERGKLLRHRFAAFIAPEDRDHWYRYFMSVLQRDDKLTCELVILRGDGSRLQVQLDSLRLLRDDKLPVVRIVLSDIAERKRAEQAVREQEEFFRMIAENIEDFIAVLDLEGRRLYNSPSYARLFGDPEDMKGTDSFAEIHPDDRERVKRVFKETVQTGISLRTEYRFVLADGSIRHMESCGELIRNSRDQASRVVVVSRDITERKQVEEQIRNLAFYDTLTQLPNRHMLDDRLNQAMAASKRSGRYGALMFLDMDNFKPLNDHYGHSAGDSLLREVARRISSCVREMDTVARFGGDEFVVMLSELDTDQKSSIVQTGIVAEKIRVILAKPYALTLQHKGDTETTVEYHCTSSIGVVMFINHEYRPADLLERADMVMYQAKESGRNRVRFFNM